MDCQYMCHCCARRFGTAGELFDHIQCQQLVLLREVQALCNLPQPPSIATVLDVIVQCVTHGTTTNDWKHNLDCPEPRCRYVSADGHQALQRHYLQHVSCDFTCPFCSKQIKNASGVARHPDNCKDRCGRSVPQDVKNRRINVVRDAHAKLRQAQKNKRFERRHLSTKTATYRRARNSHSTNDLSVAVTNTNYNVATHNGVMEGQPNTLLGSYSPSATMILPNFGNGNIYNAAGSYFSEVDSTPSHVIGDSAPDFSARVSPQEPLSASMPTRTQMYQPRTTPDSIDIERALSLTHTADGVMYPDKGQHIIAPGILPPKQTSPYMGEDFERASSLRYPVDGGAYYDVPCPAALRVSAAPELEDFAINGDIDRALSLMYPVDGTPNITQCFL